jgi:uncharacterized membrane protein
MLFCKAQAEHQEAGMQEVTGMRREIDQAGDGWLWATHVSTRVILAEALLLLALGLAGAMGWMPEELLPRRWHLLLHLLGVTMFLGNILAGAMWMARLGASGERVANRYVSVSINVGDIVLTGPGALLLLYNGLVLATVYGGTFATVWLRWCFLLFAVLGALWLLVLVPLQQRLITLADSGEDESFDRASRLYAFPGAAAGIIALVVFGLMVLRPG